VFTCKTHINIVTAKIAAGATTGKLMTLNNHLLGCTHCPEEVKKCAREWRGEPDEDDQGDQPVQTSLSASAKRARSDSAPGNTQPPKQKKFTVVSAKAHTFPPSKQVEWENQLLHAFISAGWAFNSISDLEVQKLFHDFIPGAMVPTRQKLCNQILTRELGKMGGSVREVSKGALATIQCDGCSQRTER
jgi:hypothetical protein